MPCTGPTTAGCIHVSIETIVPTCGEYPGFGPMMFTPVSGAAAISESTVFAISRVRSGARRSDRPADTVAEAVSRPPSYDGVVRLRSRRR